MKKPYLVIISLLILLSAVLRFYNLKERGIFGWDEGYYLMQGQFVYSAAKNALPIIDGIKNGEPLQILYDKHIEGTFLSTPKPLVPPVIAFAGVLTGGIKDYTVNYISALFGLLSVVLLGYIFRQLYDLESAIIALAVFGTMEYHIFITRSAYPESVPMFLLLVIVYFLSRFYSDIAKQSNIWLTAIPISLAVGYNYRFVMALFVLWMALLINAFFYNKDSKSNSIKLILVSMLCFISLSLIFELPYIILKLSSKFPDSAADATGNAIPIQSYFQMLLGWFGPRTAGNISKAKGFSFYQLKNLWLYSGPIVFVSFIYGIIRISKKRQNPSELLILLLAVVPTVFLSIGTLTGRKRALSVSLPFIAWVSSVGIREFYLYLVSIFKQKYRIFVFSSLILTIVLVGTLRSLDSIVLYSRAQEACEFLNSKNARYFSTNWGITSFYSTRHNSLYPFPKNKKELEISRQKGINYFYIDDIRHTGIPKFIRNKMFSIKPVKTYYNPDYFHDTNTSRMATPTPDELERTKRLPYVYIYKIDDFYK